MNLRRALFVAILAVPLLIALLSGFGRDPHAVPSMLEGREAPPFVLHDLNGAEVTLHNDDNMPTLLNFWATWCYPCQAEHDLLQQTARSLQGQVRVLGIIYNDSVEAVRSYVAQHGSAYPQLIDHNSRVAIDYGVAGVPESFIVDGNGVIVHKQAGVMRPEVVAQKLLPLLQRQPSTAAKKGEAPR